MHPSLRIFTILVALSAWSFASRLAGEEKNASAAELKAAATFFEQRVRPLLMDRCYKCHADKKQKGNLRLDRRSSLLVGGDAGPAVVPGHPDKSLLIEAVRYESLEMPPDRRLSKKEVQILETWVRQGAYFPGSTGKLTAPRQPGLKVSQSDRDYWAFRPIVRPAVPRFFDSKWARDNQIDAFVLKRLRNHALQPSRPASRREWLRRVYYDLIGLPPSKLDYQRFERDRSPFAYEHVVDELLGQPQYGERWGRHWLDLVRFAQTNGYERDDEKPESWRYRDYVVKSINEDKPYDQFIIEQLAGDEMERVSYDSIVATGFYRIGAWDDEPDDKIAARFENLDDILRATCETFLGLTVGCARCHDHKFDPIPQEDYYRMLAFVRNVAPYGKDKSSTHWTTNPDSVFTPVVRRQDLAIWKQLTDRIRIVNQRLQKATKEEQAKFKPELDKLVSQQASVVNKVLSVRELKPKAPETKVFIRGSHLTPGKSVTPGFLSVLGKDGESARVAPLGNSADPVKRSILQQGVSQTSGRRLTLAKWIASKDNPLTARVIVNRIWHYHFGRGLVSTPSDFGKTGELPSHPQLLDFLASEFVRNGWRWKSLHRQIVLSNTYRQSSRQHHSKETMQNALKIDPDNRLYWRQNMRRLQAEEIRDSMLVAADKLSSEMGGRGFFPPLSAEVLASQSRPGNGWGKSNDQQISRRSLYIFVKRTLGDPFMESFDQPTPDKAEPVRQTTTIAPQALILLNSKVTEQLSSAFAQRLASEIPGGQRRHLIRRAYSIALGRDPEPNELMVMNAFMLRQEERLISSKIAGSKEKAQAQALVQLCRLVLNLNEFVYLD